MAVKGGMKDRGWNPYTVGGGHSPVNNKAPLDSTSVAPSRSAGGKSPGGKKDGAPPSRKGPSVMGSSGSGQRTVQATSKSAPYAKAKAGV